MTNKQKVSIAIALELIDDAIGRLQKAGISGKGLNILLIGKAGIEKEIKAQGQKEKER